LSRRLAVLARLLWTFVRTRWGYRFRSRSALLAWQSRRLEQFMSKALMDIPYYRSYRGAAHDQLPIIDKPTMLRQFAAFNNRGIPLEAASEAAARAERNRDFMPTLPGGVTVGLSSGTSGERGVFLASDRERGLWAGAILARVLSPASLRQLLTPWARPLTVAFFLRANSRLYTTVDGRRLRFVFFDLLEPMADHVQALDALQPDLLIAPASVLGHLARCQEEGQMSLEPRQVVSVAEVLEPDDQLAAQRAWRVAVSQVYQCTEGFLAASCSSGRLHLNEEFLHVEPLWLDEAHTRFVPLLTDFTRHTQTFVRYRLDDVLRLAAEPCPCGRVTLPLEAVEGRQDDMLWLPGLDDGALRPVFADLLRRAMVMAQGSGTEGNAPPAPSLEDYRLEQCGLRWIVSLHFPEDTPTERMVSATMGVFRELRLVCQCAGLQVPDMEQAPWIPLAQGAKRRRIRCLQKPEPLVSKRSS
jgi:putative adenylate-forming enzyme